MAAQDTLQHLKDLTPPPRTRTRWPWQPDWTPARPTPDVEPYRVFCLVALGKLEEAERAAEAVIRLRPRYRPEPSEVSPRIQDLFSKARRKLGPSIVKSMYIDAKAALDRKDRDAAIARFEEMLRVADDPDVKDESQISELRLLGSGFLD